VFSRMHPDEWWLEVTGAVADAMLVREHRVPLICGRRRRQVINCLIRMQVISREMILGHDSPAENLRFDPVGEGQRMATVFRSYQKLTALTLRGPTLRSLADVKDDQSVRRAAESFQMILAGPTPIHSQRELRDAAA